MNWLQRISLAWRVAGHVARFLKDVQAAGKARLTPERARQDRRRLEDGLFNFLTNKANAGLWGYTSMDNDAVIYMQHLLKSRHLTERINGGFPNYPAH